VFTAEEFMARRDFCHKEKTLFFGQIDIKPSDFMTVLRDAVVGSGRWEKRLTP
jgi:hypothetical protein